MQAEPTVFVVDDDPAVRRSSRTLFETAGLRTEVFATAQEFLETYDASRPGCLVLDVRMPHMSGLELQDVLLARGAILPIIIITGHGEIPTAVRAMKAGAVDLFEKPFSSQALLERVRAAIGRDARTRDARARHDEIRDRVNQLTNRQREVFDAVLAGKSNRRIAAELGVSTKAVESHRAKLMAAMRADSVVHLARMAHACGKL